MGQHGATGNVAARAGKYALAVDAAGGDDRHHGQAVPGYRCEEAIPAIIDSIDTAARWQQKDDLADLVGKQVRRRLHLWQAELYAFWFGD
ncbi:MAG: hypothetical protein DYG89_38380 [Caldilinea sp. CFX5]|nr:hypothetical protein [Caldilinea sp. CFX5]